MREIKFRAFEKQTKKMFKVKQMEEEILAGTWVVGQKTNAMNYILFPAKDAILMQFTGLLDKNGKEIYEGDIIKGSFYGQGGWWYDWAEVIWKAPQFLLKDLQHKKEVFDFSHPKFCSKDKREVIGNIYQNPGFLQGELQ